MKPDQKFLNDLYTVKSVRKDSVNKITIEIALNREHDIFKGHFPGNPVLPGVCTIQILKELMELHLKQNLKLIRAGSIKYMAIIDPRKNNILNYDFQITESFADQISVTASVFFETTAFCSFRGEFKTG